MSKITEIKNQYPELNISIIDIFSKIDSTKTNKYLPLLCKLFSYRFQPNKMWDKMDNESEMAHITERMENLGFDCNTMSNNEIYAHYVFTDFFNNEDIRDIISFRKFNERGLIKNNDITSYQTFEEIRSAVGLASLKDDEKMMKSQVVKEYEDDVWLALRPLTFGASSKYGSATKWCTTYQNDKQYFERYWNRGILVYFINKVTGLKFASFKSLDNEKELSFWNAADARVDFLELEIEDYMFPVVKKILKSDKTNKDLCSMKIQIQVEIECSRGYKKSYSVESREIPMLEIDMDEPGTAATRVIQLRPRVREIQRELNDMMEEPMGYETEIPEEDTSPLRRRIQNLRELRSGIQNIEIGGAHQVGEEIGYEEDCQDSQG